MIDVTALAALLGSTLPFLTSTGEHVAKEAAQVLGSPACEHAQRLWRRLSGAVAARPAAQEAAMDVAADPQDAEAAVALVRQLRKILPSDPALAREVEQLRGQAGQAGVVASGARSVAVGVSDSTIVTGENSRVDLA
jgi:hypothetical protein